MEILVKDANFKVTEINYNTFTDSTNAVSRAIYLKSNGTVFNSDWIAFENIDSLRKNISSEILNSRAFIIERSRINKVDLEYTEEDKSILAGICSLILGGVDYLSLYKRLELVEGLLRALRFHKPLQLFYTYGHDLSYTKSMLLRLLSEENLDQEFNHTVDDLSSYLITYQGVKKYSICDLIDDLVKDHSYILDTCDFKLITEKNVYKDYTKRIDFSWCKILGKVGNLKRANLSLRILANISKDSENTEIVNEIRGISIVRDGLLANAGIVVKVNSEKLRRKLIHTGIASYLVYKNELMLDLTKLPLINRDKLKINVFDLAKTEVLYKYAKLACYYLSSVDNNTKPRESYYPTSKTEKKVSNTSYSVVMLSGVVDGFPENYKTSKASRSKKVIADFFNKLDNDLKIKSHKELSNYWENEKKRLEKKVKDLRFRLILRRSLEFRNINEPVDLSYTKGMYVTVNGFRFKVMYKKLFSEVYNYDY